MAFLKSNGQRLRILIHLYPTATVCTAEPERASVWGINAILKGLVVLGLLVAVAGCGIISAPTSAPPAQPTGTVMTVVEGTLIVSHSALEREVKAGEEARVSTGDRFKSKPDAGVTLRLPDQSSLVLSPAAISQVEDWSPDGAMVLRGLSGTMTLKARSDKVTLVMSSVTSFGLNSLDFRATPSSDGTVMRMVVDDPEVQLVVEEGEAILSINGTPYRATAVTQVSASPGLEPDIVAATTPEAGTPTPTEPADLFTPTPGTASPSQTYPYPAPTLVEPENQASLDSGTTVSLALESITKDNPDEWYEVQLWQTTAAPYTVVGRTQSTSWTSESGLQPGTYRWRIQVVRLSDGAYLSPPSETREFVVTQQSSNVTPSATTQPAQLPTVPSATGGGASSYSQPVPLSPANEAIFQADDTIVLTWDSAGTLQGDQWYEVRLWENGTEWRGAAQTRATSWQVPKDYNPGRYGWQVAVILVQDGKWVKDISPQSDMRFFVWEAPPVQGGDDDDNGSGPPSRR